MHCVPERDKRLQATAGHGPCSDIMDFASTISMRPQLQVSRDERPAARGSLISASPPRRLLTRLAPQQQQQDAMMRTKVSLN